jgi:hypothetical protein
MIYEYICEKCKNTIIKEFDTGKAKETIICDCGGVSFRNWGLNFILKGNDWPGKRIKDVNINDESTYITNPKRKDGPFSEPIRKKR